MHNNNAKKLLTNISNFISFQMDLLIFSNPYEFFQIFLRFKKKFEIFENEHNVNYPYDFVTLHITLKNFSGDSIVSCLKT